MDDDEEDQCWEWMRNDPGPEHDPANLAEFVAAYRAIYAHNCVGGNLHCVLDDENLEDEQLEWSRKHLDCGETNWPVTQAERDALRLLGDMTLIQRCRAMHVAMWAQEGEE